MQPQKVVRTANEHHGVAIDLWIQLPPKLYRKRQTQAGVEANIEAAAAVVSRHNAPILSS